MSMQYPLEGLLRPPLEWYSSTVSLTVVSLLLASPDNFLLPISLVYSCAIGLIIFALFRLKQGYRIWRYQQNLKRMPKYIMSLYQLPVSQERLFLGQGFLWTPTHTQRLHDLDLPYNKKYRHTSEVYEKARRLEFKWENKKLFKLFVNIFKKDSFLNPVRPYPDIGGEPSLHGVSEHEQAITMNLSARAGHTLVVGTTRVGKTRFAELIIGQDIRRGDVVIVFDPKGDTDLLKRIYIEAKIAGRENDLLVLHLAFPEFSCRYNAIGNFTKVTQVATRLTNALPSTGEAASFKEFAWKFVNLVTRTLVALDVRPSYKLISFYITKLDQLLIRYCEGYLRQADSQYVEWINNFIQENTRVDKKGNSSEPTHKQAIMAYAEYYTEKRNQSHLDELQNDLLIDLATACRLDRTYYDKITASIGPLLEKLTSGKVAELLSPDYNDLNDKRPIFDWLQVIRDKKIVYIGMDAMTDNVVSSTVGNSMLSDLVSVAGHLYNFGLDCGLVNSAKEKIPLPRINVHADEFNEVIGDEFIPLLNKAGGAGFNVTVYTQTWSDVEARLASMAKAGQVAGNLNNIIMFRTKEAKTVDMLLSQLPKVPIIQVLPSSSSSDSPHGEQGIFYQSNNEDRFTQIESPLITQANILNLPKGQAFCLLEGGKLYKIRVPLPTHEDIEVSESIAELLSNMQERQIIRQASAAVQVREQQFQKIEDNLTNHGINTELIESEFTKETDISPVHYFLSNLENVTNDEDTFTWLRVKKGLFINLETIDSFITNQKKYKNTKRFLELIKNDLVNEDDQYYLRYRPIAFEDRRMLDGIVIKDDVLTEKWRSKNLNTEFQPDIKL